MNKPPTAVGGIRRFGLFRLVGGYEQTTDCGRWYSLKVTSQNEKATEVVASSRRSTSNTYGFGGSGLLITDAMYSVKPASESPFRNL